MSKQGFEKFINKSKSGAKKKDPIRQEKKRIKAELKVRGEELRKQNEERYRMVTSKNAQAGTRKQDNTKREKPTGASSASKNNTGYPAQKNTRTGEPKQLQLQSAKHKKDQPALPGNEPRTGKGGSTAEEMPLNKFIAHSGICGRREAAELVKEGKVTVNGEPGYKVSARDRVDVKGKQVFLQKNLVYILVNKPKDYITTAKDPQGRKTILELVKGATQERIYPVGRLDRNTTGVLVMTNDGELAQKLTHPSFEIKKVYEVTLDKPLIKKDFDAIVQGITLDDGFVAADALGYADTKDKSVIGIEIHSGRNRIVRRIFEHLGYKVKNLDRVMFANLTKKNVDRGKWRFLNEKEIRLLKFMNQSFVRKKAGA